MSCVIKKLQLILVKIKITDISVLTSDKTKVMKF